MLKLTAKQIEAYYALEDHTNVLLYGGARSGKTFVTLDYIFDEAYEHPGSWWLVARLHATDARAAIWKQTVPTLARLKGLVNGVHYTTNEQFMEIHLENGSVVFCEGLDDPERVEKILGREYVGIYINEAQDVPWPTVVKVRTRLSQKVPGRPSLFVADLNPTTVAHWTYKLWFRGVHPETMRALGDGSGSYAKVQLNPADNEANIDPDYIRRELQTLVGPARDRFYLGQYSRQDDLQVFSPPAYYTDAEFHEWIGSRYADLRFIGGLDLGFQDADAFCLLAYMEGRADTWLIYESKARRAELSETAQAIERGFSWIATHVPVMGTDPRSTRVECDHGTIRYGTEGEKKKSWSELSRLYGFNTHQALKRDKALGVEILKADIDSGRLHIRAGGPTADECEQTIWTREEDGTIVRLINDDPDKGGYHPDILMAVLYAHRWLVNGGNQAMMREQPRLVPEPRPYADKVAEEMIDALSRVPESW